MSTPEEIVEQLATEKPGWDIYAAKDFAPKEKLVTLLRVKLESENENLSRNAALALGLMGEGCAVKKLRQMAEEPDNYIPKSSLKFVQTRGVSAIYLLGRLGDDKSVPLLLKIVENRGRTILTDFTYGEFYNEVVDVYSQYVLFAAKALMEITLKHPEQKGIIIQRVTQLLAPED